MNGRAASQEAVGGAILCSAEAMLHAAVEGKTEIVVGNGSSVFQTLPVSWLQKVSHGAFWMSRFLGPISIESDSEGLMWA